MISLVVSNLIANSALVPRSLEKALQIVIQEVEALCLNLVVEDLATGVLGHIEAD